jgi:hypothetical protein
MKSFLFMAIILLVACNPPANNNNATNNVSPTPAPTRVQKTIKDYFEAKFSRTGSVEEEDVANNYMGLIERGMNAAMEEDFVLWRVGDKDLLGSFSYDTENGFYSIVNFELYYGAEGKLDDRNKLEIVNEKVLPVQEIETALSALEARFVTKKSDKKGDKIYVEKAQRWYKLPRKDQKFQVGFCVTETECNFIPVLDLELKGDKFVIVKNYGADNFK